MASSVDTATYMSLEIKDNSHYITLDDNPISRYAHFCNCYNNEINVVDRKYYIVPNTKSKSY